MEFALNSEKRFVGAALPTGAGKTLIAMAAAKASGLRTVILTSTKGLQQQYNDLYSSCGLIDIRGKSNYQCASRDGGVNCRSGAIEGCSYTDGLGCTYECQRDIARHSKIVVSNYAFWFKINEYAPGLSPPEGEMPVELLILDEAHRSVEELSNYLKVELRETWLRTAHLTVPRDMEAVTAWSKFAFDSITNVDGQLRETILGLKRNKSSRSLRDRMWELDSLKEALSKIAWMSREDTWVCEMRLGTRYGRVWDFDCVWPGAWASKLFLGVPKILLMSATLRPTTLSMLNIAKTNSEFREWPRVFPANHTPVYHIPTVQMNKDTDEDGLAKWVGRIDEIIHSRLDRKGIIHTVSYARQQYLLDRSRFAKYMVANTSEPESPSATETVEQFKSLSAPAILVSPSFSTGWDFPGRDAEFQIIAKIPYPDPRSKVMQARLAQQPSYGDYKAMQDLVQSCGRATRSESDRCEIFCVDDGITYFLFRNKYMKPRWFEIQKVTTLPPPGPRAL